MKKKIEERTITFSEGKLEYILERKKIKNLNLRIKESGKVFVSAPYGVSIDFIENFLLANQKRIMDHLNKLPKSPSVEEQRYKEGETIFLLGKPFRISVLRGEKEGVHIEKEELQVEIKDKTKETRVETLVQRYIHNLTIKVFMEILEKEYPLFEEWKIPFPELKIRKMKSRWGSCYYTKGKIILNSRLIEKEIESIEYVVVHELVHFIHPNHSKDFYQAMTHFMPDWKERKGRLNQK